MQFSSESLNSSLIEELTPLLTKHYREIAHFQDIELDPNWARYLQMSEAGGLRVFTARDESKTLVGYAAFFVSFNLHYQGSKQAAQDVIYIEKSTRGRGIGKAFIKFCDDSLRVEGVQAVYHHIKEKHNFGPMLETMGYELVDLIYAKRLDAEVK